MCCRMLCCRERCIEAQETFLKRCFYQAVRLQLKPGDPAHSGNKRRRSCFGQGTRYRQLGHTNSCATSGPGSLIASGALMLHHLHAPAMLGTSHARLQGPYDSPSGFLDLNNKMTETEQDMPRANRMFFLSIPPNVFISAAAGAADHCSSK